MLKNLYKAIAVLIISAVILPTNVYAASKNWGLFFEKNSSTPVVDESADYLKGFDAFYRGDPESKDIYLTFDAGYESGDTASILDTLKKDGVPAAFFVTGTYVRDNPELIKRMASEGHIVGNHTWSHPDMTVLSDQAAFAAELSKTSDLYQSITGQAMPKFYRPPMGKYSEDNLRMAKDLGYKTIFWSLAYVDWKRDAQPSKEEAFAKLLTRIHPGAILLLHSTSKTNAQILDELIVKYRDMGYEFKSLNSLCASMVFNH